MHIIVIMIEGALVVDCCRMMMNKTMMNSIEVSEYAVANKIDHEPAFAQWVPDTLRKRNGIYSKLLSEEH